MFSSLAAQSRPYLGARVAYNVAGATYRDPFRALPLRLRSRAAAQVGAIFRYYFGHETETRIGSALQLEVLYSQKGYTQLLGDNSSPLIARMRYLEVPLLTHLNYILRRNYQLFLNAGVFYERLLRVTYTRPDSIPESHEIHLFQDSTDRRSGFGLRFGAGIGRELLRGKIELEAGLSLSLLDHLRSNRLLEDTPFETKLNVWFVGLSYLYPLSK